MSRRYHEQLINFGRMGQFMNNQVIFSVILGGLLCLLSSSAVAWKVNIHCDNGVVGKNVYGKNNYSFSDAAGHTYYSDFSPVKGNGSCELNIDQGDDGWGTWGGRKWFPTNLVKGDEVWLRVHLFFPKDFDYRANPRLKFLRLRTQSSDHRNQGYIDWLFSPKGATWWSATDGNQPETFVLSRGVQNKLKRFGTDLDRPKLGVWETYEMYVKLDNVSVDNGGSGRVRVWKNGVLKGDFTSFKTLIDSDSISDSVLLFTYWNGGKYDATGDYPRQTQKMYFDDLVVQTDPPTNMDVHGNLMIGVGERVADAVSAPGIMDTFDVECMVDGKIVLVSDCS